jgi:hypothetical protein
MLKDIIEESMKLPYFALAYGILAALFGFFIGNRLAIDRNRNQEFNKAAETFREVFQPILIIVNPAQHILKEDLPRVLERDFEKQKSAIIEFSNYLRSAKAKRALLKAWQEYHCQDNDYHENCMPYFEKYWMLGKTDAQRHEIFKVVETRIKNILKFAQPK